MLIVQLIGLTNCMIAFTQAHAHVAFIIIGMVSPLLMLLYLLINAKARAAFRM